MHNKSKKDIAKQFVMARLKELEKEAKARGTSLKAEARKIDMNEATLWRWRVGKTEATLYEYQRLYDAVMAQPLKEGR